MLKRLDLGPERQERQVDEADQRVQVDERRLLEFLAAIALAHPSMHVSPAILNPARAGNIPRTQTR
jgi:hypothetical protein